MSCQLATYLESNALGLVPGEPSPNYSWDQKEPTYENLPEYRRMTKASHTASRRLVRIVVPPPSRMSFASEQLFA
ncbi:uncharacterized protein L969DRAFT_48971 [Mixia osmundae IAM 14324]|uniref:Uncharacterized protein n=1 Tax=Mixia osmundae (strain CBS 9802 / IAM 14324 / JCM 22182 / KY 12970) TaxID=764103 RepID=G7E483_MIXOS|nr:uncharacterized protein L969DRAFT_48971 [Mixia osmundae IAM 14324]KEI39739.1 hypothetical protein L969DRAFT_48971 [Mixia osmundae IAM 14324]GAA97643.1 hypothetical protein E5Q_04321 [Mixia osmundae IAM 14324]